MNKDEATSDHGLVLYAAASTNDAANVFAAFPTDTIPQISAVRLYSETVQHVLDRHPEVPGALPGLLQIAAVEKAVNDPTTVEKTYKNGYVYTDATTTNDAGDPFNVAVRCVDGSSARVATYYFATREQTQIIYERPYDE